MDFEAFENLEKFNILSRNIEEISYKNSSSKDSDTDKKEGGITITRDNKIKRD